MAPRRSGQFAIQGGCIPLSSQLRRSLKPKLRDAALGLLTRGHCGRCDGLTIDVCVFSNTVAEHRSLFGTSFPVIVVYHRGFQGTPSDGFISGEVKALLAMAGDTTDVGQQSYDLPRRCEAVHNNEGTPVALLVPCSDLVCMSSLGDEKANQMQANAGQLVLRESAVMRAVGFAVRDTSFKLRR